MAYPWITVLIALYSVLLLVVVLFGLGLCHVAGRTTEPDLKDVEEWLDEAALTEESAAQTKALDEESWLDVEPRMRRAGVGS